ncbi:transcriptional regulator [Bosea lupini]|uniref:Transcriptional regulator n=1 Tax=Bosea lupini TaxID=1036779 RepID=A0A1H7VGW9_9HYPH|nr:IclR family transcriptional regulator C-terminal domain-containing protein [Bosea lupini]SEM08486.1 transcriptional regulator [Bosea lupini]
MPLTSEAPTSTPGLIETVEAADARGHVVSRGVMEAAGSSISAPIIDRRGTVVAAIDISGPDSAFDLDQIDGRYLTAVRATARRSSERLG